MTRKGLCLTYALRAGDASQAITMHWGNVSAAKPKYLLPVFDTPFGVAAAWHLGEEAADTVTDGLYQDATGAGNNGNDRLRNTSVTGEIAGGQVRFRRLHLFPEINHGPPESQSVQPLCLVPFKRPGIGGQRPTWTVNGWVTRRLQVRSGSSAPCP